MEHMTIEDFEESCPVIGCSGKIVEVERGEPPFCQCWTRYLCALCTRRITILKCTDCDWYEVRESN